MTGVSTSSTPYVLVSAVEPAAEVSKRELVRLSRQLEREAQQDRPPAVAATLQDARFLTARTRAVYADLAERGARVRLHARGLQAWLAPGVAGVALDDDDPLVDEWSVLVLGSRPVVFAATDLGRTDCEDDDRSFRCALSRDRDVVAAVARVLGV